MGNLPQDIGKWLVVMGAVIAAFGAGLWLLGGMNTGLFRLPGDLQFGSKNWRVYLPITTCIVLSAVMTLIFWIIRHFRR
jgi:hypothetical protein